MLKEQLNRFDQIVKDALAEDLNKMDVEEMGQVVSLDRGIAIVDGLKKVKYQELIQFSNGTKGMAFNLDPDQVGVLLLGEYNQIHAGEVVKRTYEVADIPVGRGFIGRVINPLGEPMDGKGMIKSTDRFSIEREAPPILDRAPVIEPLQTGIKVIDAIVPIGKGQRELILGDRQTGKTAIAIDTILNQQNKNVICIYCAIGQQISSISKTIDVLEKSGAMEHTILVIAQADDPPGLSYVAPYAATALGEFFMDKGEDVLIIYDDLTKHARSYRELSLLLERPPGREAYPGDIFYIHSRLLERSTHLKEELGGGSLTALPIIETQAENISAYIPTNLISITDGQIFVSPKIFNKGNIPAVSIGASVSRVGGKTQLAAYRSITSALKLTYSQFEEMEIFASFGTKLDDETKQILNRGERIRKIFNQPQFEPVNVIKQIGVFLALTEGLFDNIPLDDLEKAEKLVGEIALEDTGLNEIIYENQQIDETTKSDYLERIRSVLKELVV
ncbi:alternate F1F0 ATPase, F1 subunit alpha [Alkalibacter rhizosphaerae]|uniref:ATP synthase subunit alpha n=1 Tax=Alkalibacter rhizosphaerae TaxID=2815577 RepID=A0A974XHM9_9FIRM|nr:alternate F1F0 ATPase, F1 subunit alpha [Alkalibacter rhizosphaerae]QSX08538.1 alternate F1F0 ATPase, F1 subunit alpha [Alkalibacter rhizosphaerae]